MIYGVINKMHESATMTTITIATTMKIIVATTATKYNQSGAKLLTN